MANSKEVDIVAEMPYNWTEKLEPAEAQFLCSLFLNPAMGIHIHTNGAVHYVPNKRGGRTAIYHTVISGKEALRDDTLHYLVSILRKYADSVLHACARDVENQTTWQCI